MQFPFDAAAAFEDFLADRDPDLLDDVRNNLNELADSGAVDMYSSEKRAALVEHAERVVSTLEDRFDERASASVETSSEIEAQRARHHLRTLSQWVDQRRGKNPLRIRDKALAENISWILNNEAADRIAIWGHNAHIKRGTAANGAVGIKAPAMGQHLHQKYGDQYYALGVDFGCGSCRVHSQADNEFESLTIEAPPAESIPDIFGSVDESLFVFESAEVQSESALAEWLEEGPRRHVIVGSYEDDPVQYVEATLDESFDGFVFVEETTPDHAD